MIRLQSSACCHLVMDVIPLRSHRYAYLAQVCSWSDVRLKRGNPPTSGSLRRNLVNGALNSTLPNNLYKKFRLHSLMVTLEILQSTQFCKSSYGLAMLSQINDIHFRYNWLQQLEVAQHLIKK